VLPLFVNKRRLFSLITLFKTSIIPFNTYLSWPNCIYTLPKKVFYKAFLAVLILSVACVDPYLATFAGTGKATILVIDGRLTNDPSVNHVNITEAIPSGKSGTSFLGVSGAKVNVLVNESASIPLNEVQSGRYEFPNGFAGEFGKNYKLKITTSEGKFFESKSEPMLNTPGIEKVYDTFDIEAVKTITSRSPGFNIYIDMKDPVEEENYYMWDWRYYESQVWCKTCSNGYYYNDASTDSLGECRPDNFRRGKYDYYCKSPCWQVYRSENFNIMNDDFSNGQLVKNRLVASIPLYSYEGALMEVRQFSVSEDAYDYLRLIISQGQETGGLADTPPATLVGNIVSRNPDQLVTGYFIVSSVTKALHWMDKRNVQGNVRAIGLFPDKRLARPEPLSESTTRPPLAACLARDSRTTITPTGWLYGEK
jgi:hypothetical protein